MASPAMKLSLFLLLSLFSSLHTHARESQFFNKIPSTTTTTTTNTQVPTNQQDPTFLPDNDNSYGLYGHESGLNPPSTTTATAEEEFKQTPNKYLPKNYNPVAYVTQPESDLNDSPASFTKQRTFSTNPNNNNNNYYNADQNSFYNQQQQEQEQEQEQTEFKSYRNPASNNNNFYYNGGSSFNSQPQGQDSAFQPQGMSDTRVMANGKFYYDTNSESYSSNHPYETMRGARPQNEFNNRNFYGNNAYEFNQDQFQDDDNNLP
ncbi:protein E6 [Salvia hispanica]|uniref:protein E6 n=1 Tax=Salvia hispanica TaxID=49212 RepID=UPI002008F6C9|nr:protein E6 [Salvia hispanica]